MCAWHHVQKTPLPVTAARTQLTQQSQQPHGGQHRLAQQLHVRRVRVVDLETRGQCALREGMRVVAQEGVVVAQQRIVNGGAGVGYQ